MLLLCAGDFTLLTAQADPDVYIYDYAELVGAQDEAGLQSQGANIAEIYDCGVYVFNVPDMGEYGYHNIDDFAEFVYNEYRLGVGAERNMVMLVISMEDRDYDIIAHGGTGNAAFTDYGKDMMAEQFIPHLSSGDHASAYKVYMNVAEEYLSMYAGGTPFDVPSGPSTAAERNGMKVGGSVVAGLIGALLSTLGLKSQMKSVHTATIADRYVTAEGLQLSLKRDTFVNRTVTRTPIPKQRSSGGGGGTTINAGGFSHKSGKF